MKVTLKVYQGAMFRFENLHPSEATVNSFCMVLVRHADVYFLVDVWTWSVEQTFSKNGMAAEMNAYFTRMMGHGFRIKNFPSRNTDQMFGRRLNFELEWNTA